MSDLPPYCVLLLGAHRWGREPAVHIAIRSGLTPVVLLYEAEHLPKSLEGTLQPWQILRVPVGVPAHYIAREMSRRSGQWFVVPLDDYVSELGSQIAELSAAPIMAPGAAQQALDKNILRAKWNNLCERRSDITAVPFRLLTFRDLTFRELISVDENGEFLETVPLIVKPSSLDASIGVHRIPCWSEINQAVNAVTEDLTPLLPFVGALGINISPRVIVEHEIQRARHLHEGSEFSAEMFARATDGEQAGHILVGVTQKYICPLTFVEIAHSFPSESFPSALISPLEAITAFLLDELGVRHCISHWEYIITTSGQLALVEAQLRPAGDYITTLIERATGENPYAALFTSLRQHRQDFVPRFMPKRIATVFFPSPTEHIEGAFKIVCDEPSMLGGNVIIVDDAVEAATGWEVDHKWNSRFLVAFADGPSFEENARQCRSNMRMLKVERRSPSPGKPSVPLTVRT